MGPAPHPSRWGWFHTGSVGNDVGPAPHPSLNRFFFEKRNGLEIQRKSLSLAVAGCLVVLVGSADIVSSRSVEERTGASTPLSRFWLYSHSFAPYCFSRKTVGRMCNYNNQSKRPSEVDAAGLSIYHPTKSYTRTNYITAKLTTTARPQRLSLGF